MPWIILRLFDPKSRQFYWALGAAVIYGLCWWWVRDDITAQFADDQEAAAE